MSQPKSIRVGTSGDLDLLFAVEDVFCISFTQEDVAPIVTVGNLYDLILSKLRKDYPDGCLRGIAFYRLRQAILNSCPVGREQVRLDTLVEFLIPADQRIGVWAELKQRLQVKLPELEYPHWIEQGVLWSGIAGAIFLLVGFFIAGLRLIPMPWSLIPSASGAVLLLLSGAISRRRARSVKANRIPASCYTVRLLVEQIVTWNYGDLARRNQMISEAEVFAVVRNIVVETLLADPDKVTRDAQLSQFPAWD